MLHPARKVSSDFEKIETTRVSLLSDRGQWIAQVDSPPVRAGLRMCLSALFRTTCPADDRGPALALRTLRLQSWPRRFNPSVFPTSASAFASSANRRDLPSRPS